MKINKLLIFKKIKTTQNRKDFFLLLIITVITIISCDTILPTPIERILNNPREYHGKNVMVEGEVTDAFFIFIKYFKIRGKTAKLWL